MMNTDTYRHHIPYIKDFIASPQWKGIKSIGRLSLITYVPIIILCELVGEIIGVTPELTTQIQSLKTFYGVKGE